MNSRRSTNDRGVKGRTAIGGQNDEFQQECVQTLTPNPNLLQNARNDKSAACPGAVHLELTACSGGWGCTQSTNVKVRRVCPVLSGGGGKA